MPRILPDVEPLRVSRDYRLLWSGQLISQAGSAVRLVAIPYQIYLLTQSSFAVGLIGLFSAIPLVALSMFGGVIADRVDRRRLLLVTQTCLCATSLTLAVSTQLGFVSVPLLYALTAIGASFGALDGPARAAIAPTLVERRLIPSVAPPRTGSMRRRSSSPSSRSRSCTCRRSRRRKSTHTRFARSRMASRSSSHVRSSSSRC